MPRVKRQVLLLLGVYYPANHHGIARYAREAGWTLDNLYEKGGLVPTWWNGDGIITLIAHPKDIVALRQLPRKPLVDLSKGWITNALPPELHRTGRGKPRVLYDNVNIARLAAKHFLERGFRNVAFFNYGNWWMETERIPPFRQTIRAAGATYHQIDYHRHFSRTMQHLVSAERAAHLWLMDELRKLPKPLGVFAATNDIALVVLRACSEAGLSVPEEVAVLGCDNEPLVCDFAQVPLSSVDPDLERQGYEAAKLLERLMDGESPPREPVIIPPVGVVVRQSTDILAVPHVPTARALRFIWEHYREPIQTAHVVAAAGMSRRGLEHAFNQHLHRSIREEIIRLRIESARDLLTNTGLKVFEVAERSGFSDLPSFFQMFRRETGVRPLEYRRRAGK